MADKNILLVDDAAFMRMMLKNILVENGYNVVSILEQAEKIMLGERR